MQYLPHRLPKKQALTRVARLSIENKVDALLLDADKTLAPKVALEKSLEAKALAESIAYEPGIVKSLHRAATNTGSWAITKTRLLLRSTLASD